MKGGNKCEMSKRKYPGADACISDSPSDNLSGRDVYKRQCVHPGVRTATSDSYIRRMVLGKPAREGESPVPENRREDVYKRQVLDGTLSLGTLFIFITYISSFFEPIQELAEQFGTLQSCLLYTSRCV